MPSVKEIYHKIDDVRIEADSINLNVDGLEALAATQQADVAAIKTDISDGVTINQPVDVRLKDGAGNNLTSTTQGATRRLDVMLSSGGATGSAAPTNANLMGGTDGTNLRGLSVDSSGRLNVSNALYNDGTLTYTNTGAITSGSVVIASTDVTNYREASIHIVAMGSGGGGIIPQISNDNSNWVASSAQNAIGTSTASTLTSTSSIFKVNFQAARYFRIVTSGTISSGTTTIVVYLSNQVTPAGTQLVALSSMPASASSGHSLYHTAISAASTNATNVKTSQANIGSLHLVNTTASLRYFKLFNSASAPTVGTSTPVLNYAIPPNSTISIDCGYAGIRLTTGLSYAITAGQALLDNTAVGAGDVVVNIAYI